MIDDLETNANEAKPAVATEEQEVGSPCEKVHLGHFREDRVRGGILLSVVQEEAEEAEAGAHLPRSFVAEKGEVG